jgi:thiol-disulfide isomerase/thioredoxin
MRILRNISILLVTIGVMTFAANAQTSLTSLDGARVDVQGQNGKVVILAVGAKWLPLSKKQADFTNILARKYAGKNVAVYFVLTDSTNPKSRNRATDEELRTWASENKVTVQVLRDPDGAATLQKFGIDQLPSFVVLDKSGNRDGDNFGGIDPAFDITVPISKRVDSLL